MTVLYGILVGLALGLTGGGGSMLAVPLLVYGLELNPRNAVDISLATVTCVAAIGAVTAIHAKLVEYRAALIFALGGILFAPLGVTLGNQVSESTIITAFAILMLVVASLMWLKVSSIPQNSFVVRSDFVPGMVDTHSAICRFTSDKKLRLTARCGIVLSITGAVTGTLTGFFGVGGGFLIVPALGFITRMGIYRSVATSLMVITLVGMSGLLTVVARQPDLPLQVTGLFVTGGIAGMLLGRILAHRIAGPNLQKIFILFIVVIALYIL